MATFAGGTALSRGLGLVRRPGLLPRPTVRRRHDAPSRRFFSEQRPPKRPRFSSRLRDALRNTKVQWYQIPVGLGIGFLGLVQFYKVSRRERERLEHEAHDGEGDDRPRKRPRIRPDGPWCVSPAAQTRGSSVCGPAPAG